MLEILEKLINEHGSSVILKERLELINDKYEAIEGKLANAEKEMLKQQVAELRDQISASKPAMDELPQEQQAILKILFNTNKSVRDELIARELNLEIGVLNYHLDELLEKKLLNHPSYIMGSAFTGHSGYREQSISKKGRKYFIEIIGT